jgi:UDP-N-acetylglucosamine 1-carboxyvinyltransferase
VDLCSMLTLMGAKVDGAGTSTITVEGVSALEPVAYTTVPDRIVAGTWAIGAVMTRGDVVIERAVADHLTVALDKLTAAGARIEALPEGIRVVMEERPRGVDVVTLPYPGFPTDLQPMAVALAAVSTGTALITENVFEGRFMFVNELVRLGAAVRIDGHHAVVRGRERLSSAPVVATDIRAGAGLILAGLVSDGVTEVQEVHHVDRGYPDFAEQLRGLGARVERVRREP